MDLAKARPGKEIRIATMGLIATILVLVSGIGGCASSTGNPVPSVSPETLAYQIDIELLGTKQKAPVDFQHRLLTRVQVVSPDGSVSLTINKGSRLQDKDGKPLEYIRVMMAENLPLPPKDTIVVGAAYSLEPRRAAAFPGLLLTLSYDLTDLSGGTRETDVYIAPYEDETGWGTYQYKKVDAEKHQVTGQVERFSTYAILAPVTPPPQLTLPVPKLTSIPLNQALSSGKPTIAEFGASTCIPCKQMKPILEELAKDYQGRVNVILVEVYDQMELTRQYKIMTIPTQILFDSEGKEVSRHIGLWPKAEIVAQMNKMGIK